MSQKQIYSKPYLPPRDLVLHLKRKGLNFSHPEDETKAEKTLSKVNYYRFKSYLLPFFNKTTNNYEIGTEFSQGLLVYDFDCELRTICNKYLLKLEVKLKSQLDQTITKYTGNPFWYLCNEYFSKPIDYIRIKIENSMQRSNDDFAIHYRKKYTSNIPYYSNLPPFWIASELTTFGMLNDIVMNLNKDKIGSQRNNPLDNLAKDFGASSWKELRSWIPLIKEIRNCCSHSNRTWNRNFRTPSGFVDNQNQIISNRITTPPTMKNKIYLGLAVIYKMTKDNMINDHCFKGELQHILSKFNTINNMHYQMGFPLNWEQEPIWQ